MTDKTDMVLMALCIMLLIFLALACFGCAILQPRGGNTIADLPTTGPEAMFQTLKKANWLFTLSVIGVGAGFFAFLNGSSKGLQFMAACFVVISLIIGLTRYSAVIAVISMIGTACLMIYSVLVKNKAVREVIQGVEKAKHSLTDSPEGKETLMTALESAQSKTTEAIVKAVKNKL
ncbi:hypothetical protein LCGC14_2444350 [marine sediment metagenome]|uniref:Uncharacterized protein n=1 Tax=marine sediment metagenome TaxID=412755 RepID=A0A0F9BI83_9ZZZZ